MESVHHHIHLRSHHLTSQMGGGLLLVGGVSCRGCLLLGHPYLTGHFELCVCVCVCVCVGACVRVHASVCIRK